MSLLLAALAQGRAACATGGGSTIAANESVRIYGRDLGPYGGRNDAVVLARQR